MSRWVVTVIPSGTRSVQVVRPEPVPDLRVGDERPIPPEAEPTPEADLHPRVERQDGEHRDGGVEEEVDEDAVGREQPAGACAGTAGGAGKWVS